MRLRGSGGIFVYLYMAVATDAVDWGMKLCAVFKISY